MVNPEYKEDSMKEVIEAAECLLVKDGKVLLCLKKKGSLWQGRLVGPGGKVESYEDPRNCAIRETVEELKVKPTSLEEVGNIYFDYAGVNNPNPHHVTFYLVDKWEGEIRETEELKPEWLDMNELPYERMLPGDGKFLLRILTGHSVRGRLRFDEQMNVVENSLCFVTQGILPS